jgi:hypothetical protein
LAKTSANVRSLASAEGILPEVTLGKRPQSRKAIITVLFEELKIERDPTHLGTLPRKTNDSRPDRPIF